MRISCAFAVLVGLVACARGAKPSAPPRSEEIVPSLEALGRGDADALREMFGAELVVTLGSMNRTGAQILERTRAAASAGVIRNETAEAVSVQRYGDVVVARGTAVVRDPDGRVDRMPFTNVWLWRDGRWQLVAGHVGPAATER